MTNRIPLPAGGRVPTLDIVDPNSTAVQRSLRRNGLAAYEPPTLTTLRTLFDTQVDGFTFLDVGANMGLYALICASMFTPGCPGGQVRALGPVVACVRVRALARRASHEIGSEMHVECCQSQLRRDGRARDNVIAPMSGRQTDPEASLDQGFCVERMTGIEPAFSAWETEVPRPPGRALTWGNVHLTGDSRRQAQCRQ